METLTEWTSWWNEWNGDKKSWLMDTQKSDEMSQQVMKFFEKRENWSKSALSDQIFAWPNGMTKFLERDP